MTAIDKLRAHPPANAEPPPLTELLREAILEIADRIPKEDEGADPSAAAPARANPSGTLPPDGPPVSSPEAVRLIKEGASPVDALITAGQGEQVGHAPDDQPSDPPLDTNLRTWDDQRRVTEGAPD